MRGCPKFSLPIGQSKRIFDSVINSAIDDAVNRLLGGDIVVFPTETFYGLGVDPKNAAAVKKMLAMKSREEGQGVPLIISAEDILDGLLDESDDEVTKKRREVQSAFWPGPLTLVVGASAKARQSLAKGIFGPEDTLALRLSSEPVALCLAQRIGGMITASSANPHGLPPASDAEEAANYYPELFILSRTGVSDVGPSTELPSTLLDVRKRPFSVIRHGAVNDHELSPWLDARRRCGA